jgi:hypothetical protein
MNENEATLVAKRIKKALLMEKWWTLLVGGITASENCIKTDLILAVM